MVATIEVTQVDEEWFARHAPDPRPLPERIRTGRRRQQLTAAAVAVPAAIGAGVVGFLLARHYPHRSDPPTALVLVALVLILAGLAVELSAVWRLRGELRRNWVSPLFALTLRARRAVLKQAWGRTPAAAADVPFVRELAGRIVALARLNQVFVGLVVIYVGNALQHPHGWPLWVALALLIVAGGVQFARQQAGARRFLATHQV